MNVNLSELRPSQYVVPGFFDRPPAGLYALCVAHALQKAGVTADEWLASCSGLADRLSTHYADAALGPAARAALREDAGRWASRCQAAAELLSSAVSTLDRGTALAGFVAHLGRIANQLALLEGIAAVHA